MKRNIYKKAMREAKKSSKTTGCNNKSNYGCCELIIIGIWFWLMIRFHVHPIIALFVSCIIIFIFALLYEAVKDKINSNN